MEEERKQSKNSPDTEDGKAKKKGGKPTGWHSGVMDEEKSGCADFPLGWIEIAMNHYLIVLGVIVAALVGSCIGLSLTDGANWMKWQFIIGSFGGLLLVIGAVCLSVSFGFVRFATLLIAVVNLTLLLVFRGNYCIICIWLSSFLLIKCIARLITLAGEIWLPISELVLSAACIIVAIIFLV